MCAVVTLRKSMSQALQGRKNKRLTGRSWVCTNPASACRAVSKAMVAASNTATEASRATAAAGVDAVLARASGAPLQPEGAAEGASVAAEPAEQQQGVQGTVGSAAGVVAVEEVVAAAVGSLPVRAATQGVATLQQLAARCAGPSWVSWGVDVGVRAYGCGCGSAREEEEHAWCRACCWLCVLHASCEVDGHSICPKSPLSF